MNKHMKFCKLRVIVQADKKIRNYFIFKDFAPETVWSGLIYKFSCGSRTAYYIGNTFRYFKLRYSEYKVVSSRRDKLVKGALSTTVRNHILVCDHKVVHEDFELLGNGSSRYLLELKVYSLKGISHHFYKNLCSQELPLFWVFHLEQLFEK